MQPGGPPLVEASFSHATISPNADGDDDVTRIAYTLRRPAEVSIYFVDSQGRRFDFRLAKPREAGEHSVDFSGVVDPFEVSDQAPPADCLGESLSADDVELSEDLLNSEVLARVLPNGSYTWVVQARDAQGQL